MLLVKEETQRKASNGYKVTTNGWRNMGRCAIITCKRLIPEAAGLCPEHMAVVKPGLEFDIVRLQQASKTDPRSIGKLCKLLITAQRSIAAIERGKR